MRPKEQERPEHMCVGKMSPAAMGKTPTKMVELKNPGRCGSRGASGNPRKGRRRIGLVGFWALSPQITLGSIREDGRRQESSQG
jgi:hypothetical protein